MPIINSGTDLWTYADLVQYVVDSHALERTGLNERHARAAVRKAYRDLANFNEWNYYYRQRLIRTVAEYSTGTVEFDYTGGANERMLTLTTGTWPSWAAYGRVIIDSTHYEVATRESDSIITLTETSNPGEDIAAGETYTLYRSAYPLPADFKAMCGLWEVSERYPMAFIDQRTQHDALLNFYESPSTPRHATIRATGRYQGGLEIVFGPPPSTAMTYDLLYQASPRAITIDEHFVGSVSITAGTAAVTGSSTAFPVNCAGSVIRFSSGLTKPSSFLGSLDGADNPFVYQGIIKTRTSATALVLEESMPSAVGDLTSVGYVISDPLDIDVSRMLSALQIMAEAEFSRLSARNDAGAKLALARVALREALEFDNPASNTRGAISPNNIDWASVTNDPA